MEWGLAPQIFRTVLKLVFYLDLQDGCQVYCRVQRLVLKTCLVFLWIKDSLRKLKFWVTRDFNIVKQGISNMVWSWIWAGLSMQTDIKHKVNIGCEKIWLEMSRFNHQENEMLENSWMLAGSCVVYIRGRISFHQFRWGVAQRSRQVGSLSKKLSTSFNTSDCRCPISDISTLNFLHTNHSV